jgi:hypothetical protein
MTPPEIDNGVVELSFAAVVLNHDVGGTAFFVDGPLGLFPALELLFAPPPPQGSLQPHVSGTVDHEDDIADGPPAGFEQNWGIEDDGGPAFRTVPLAEPVQPLANQRMK